MSVESLRKARNSGQAVFIEFTKAYSKEANTVFCFFEGKDSAYYRLRITTRIGVDDYKKYCCGGKKGVLDAQRLITNKSQYSTALLAFFIDRDFDDSIYSSGIQEVYETPCYSIENLYTSIECFSKILKDEFSLTEEDEDFQRCINLYNELIQEFFQKTETLNTWLACQKDKGVKLNLSSYDIFDFIRLNLYEKNNRVQVLYNLEKLYTVFSDSIHLGEDELAAKLCQLKQLEPHKSFRGKFGLQFFIKFLNKLSEDACSRNRRLFTEKLNVSLNVSVDNALSFLSHYADTPKCLINYLDSVRFKMSSSTNSR